MCGDGDFRDKFVRRKTDTALAYKVPSLCTLITLPWRHISRRRCGVAMAIMTSLSTSLMTSPRGFFIIVDGLRQYFISLYARSDRLSNNFRHEVQSTPDSAVEHRLGQKFGIESGLSGCEKIESEMMQDVSI